MPDWEQTLNKYGLMIEDSLRSFLIEETKNASSYHPYIRGLYEDLREYVLRGGKRLASCSTLMAHKGFNKEVNDQILDVCVGIELYRHSILVHDDLVDDDELRRGGIAIHKKYRQEYDSNFGSSLAVFAGNILYAMALKALSNSKLGSNKILSVLNLLNHAFQAVNESQILDLLFEYRMPNVEEWYVMASKRAASLFTASIQIGATVADASEKDLQLLRSAAEHIGYCFDIQDDIIDTFASEEQYGRRPGGDLSKHKKPLHVIYTYIMADRPQLEAMENAVRKNTVEDLNRIRKVMVDCGALEAAKSRSRQHADSARKLILETTMSHEAKEFYISFIHYVKESLSWYK